MHARTIIRSLAGAGLVSGIDLGTSGLGGYSIVQFLAAYWLFDRLRDSFAEVV